MRRSYNVTKRSSMGHLLHCNYGKIRMQPPKKIKPSSLYGGSLFSMTRTHTSSSSSDSSAAVNIAYNSTRLPPHRPETYSPVVILGGGPTGLLLSSLLSQYNVPSTLLERRLPEQIHLHPQAHYINLRSMEILRHSLPHVYDKVMEQSPPVDHWEAFTFGSCVLGRQMARVIHPVRGIQVGQDGNGRLEVMKNDEDPNRSSSLGAMISHDTGLCSICSPTHLAQNKFALLLLEEAQRLAKLVRGMEMSSEISHGETVQSVVELSNPPNSLQGKKLQGLHDANLLVETNQRSIMTHYVVVAEGYHSPTRVQHGGTWVGNPTVQHLINVHFQTSKRLSKYLEKQKDRVGMLHFVFHKEVVGAFVCHDVQEGEWVLQIPYFAPFQDVSSFTVSRVREIVSAGLGLDCHIHKGHGEEDSFAFTMEDVEILSIKPWTMAATVAKEFNLGMSKRIILAGDAAHAFPPAGGFGMNTGLQDAHNLAWRLACLIHHGRHDGEEQGAKDNPEYMLREYESERRSIATQNAALSVRNYNRTLDIAKACYLNAKHPSVLRTVMESPPMSLIPMNVRQEAFGAAVKAAMLPLTNLEQRGNLYGDVIEKNVRRILSSGGGLPLIFPRYEIGFSYDPLKKLDDKDDTAGYHPKMEVGYRLPHLEVDLLSIEKKDHGGICKTLTMTDIESQLRQRWEVPSPPRYCLLLYKPFFSQEMLDRAETWAQNHCPYSFDTVELYSNRLEAMDKVRKDTTKQNIRPILLDVHGAFLDLIRDKNDKSIIDDTTFYALLVRPDGHIANITSYISSQGNG